MAEAAVTTASAREFGPSDNVWAFAPTPKVDAGERSVLVAETYERVRRIARRVPIARVTDLTPLDDLGLPAARGGERGPRRVFWSGTHPDPDTAVFRAVSEAVQSRLIVIQSARDSYNNIRTAPRRFPAATAKDRQVPPPRRRAFGDVRGFRSMDLRADLQVLLERLRLVGVGLCVAVDLTSPSLSIPVVRVRIGGLSPYVLNMRQAWPSLLQTSTVNTTARSLIAFVGPSLSRPEAARLCPGLDIRPPIRRDDLYRERELGAWGFLIVDGVFMQEDAVSPREVVDVLEDSALVIGASSMGALRAADCWPAGGRGIGLIYRLYRLGVLESDEEVAVAVSGDGSDTAVSVPLVNVRYAISRAVGRRLIDRAAGRRIVDAAAGIYYPERTWKEVLRRAEPVPAALFDFCTSLALEREDAARAMRYVRPIVQDAPQLAALHGRRGDGTFSRSEVARDRASDATGGIETECLRMMLCEWMIGTGRLARYRAVSSWSADDSRAERDRFACEVWSELEQLHQRDAELMRLRAVERAMTAARDAGLTPEGRDRRAARREIAIGHGFRSWRRLVGSAHGRRFAPEIARAEERLAVARQMRDVWFGALAAPARRGLARWLPGLLGRALERR